MDIRPKEHVTLQVTPYTKLQLKSIERRQGSTQETAGLLTLFHVSQKVDGLDTKLRLKGIERRRGSAQETAGLLTLFKVSQKVDALVEDVMAPSHGEHDHTYVPEIDTFKLRAITDVYTEPIPAVQDGAVRWKILVILVAILVISLISIGIFGAYLLRPVFIHYLHMLIG